MRRYGVAFLGFGNVAKALARLLDAKRTELAVRYGISCHATGVASRSLGWWANADGLTLTTPNAGTRCYDIGDWLLTARPDVVFESISLDPHTGQPALDYLAETLRAGIHAVSANKGPVVYGYQRLAALAESHGRLYRFESAVMDGAPVFSLARRGVPLAGIRGVSGTSRPPQPSSSRRSNAAGRSTMAFVKRRRSASWKPIRVTTWTASTLR